MIFNGNAWTPLSCKRQQSNHIYEIEAGYQLNSYNTTTLISKEVLFETVGFGFVRYFFIKKQM